MKPFDPGGSPHALADGQPMACLHSHIASSGGFASVQLCARREFFCPRGLKEGIFSEDAEKRVLHSTYRATLYLTASTAPASASQGASDNAAKSTGQFLHSSRNIKALDGSIWFPETVAGRTEGQEHTPVDCSSRVHKKFKKIMACGNVQLEQESSSHVSTSFDESVVLSNQLGAFSLCLSKSLQNNYLSTSSNSTSLQALHIPKALALPMYCDEMQQPNEFCVEDPDAPSTPDLQSEVRSWDCEALCTTGLDQMHPADNLYPTGASDLVLGENPCNKGADDMLPAHKLLLKEEAIASTCMFQCPAGPAEGFHALMKQGEDTCENYSSVSDLSYKCSSSFLCDNSESANNKKASRKLNAGACREYMAQQLFYCLMISARSICATPNNEKPFSEFLRTLWSLQRLISSLKWEGFCEGEVMFEQLLTDIQIFLQVHSPRLIPDQDRKVMEGSPAACCYRIPVHKQVHIMVKKYSGRSGHLQSVDTKIIVQEEMLDMLRRVFSQRYVVRRSGNSFWHRCLYLEQDIVGNCKSNHSSSRLPSKNSTSNSPSLLETENEILPRSIAPSCEMIHDFEENLAESHGSSSWGWENGPIKIMEVVDNWNGIPIEQVEESLDTCHSLLQAPPSAFPSDVTKLLELSPKKKQSEALNIKRSNGNIIDGEHGHYLVFTKDNRDKASCLPMSAVGGPCSPTLSQCSLSLGFRMEESKSSMLPGEVHKRHSRVKLEHFAEVFLLRRHIKQQQRKAQKAPPYLCRESVGLAADAKGLTRAGLLLVGKPGPHTYLFTNGNTKSSENMNHEPTSILTSSVTKPSDACDHRNCVGADVVIDIVGLVKYLESHSSQLETLTDAAVNSTGCTHMPFTGGQLVIPNVNAIIVTIVAIVVYTKILLEGALSWVGSQTHSKEEK